ncbi:hypothetical protein [Bradyrhizobium sp. BRP23]|nr:hypothetical protein [Bradyrhizobium sp. BRP23]
MPKPNCITRLAAAGIAIDEARELSGADVAAFYSRAIAAFK